MEKKDKCNCAFYYSDSAIRERCIQYCLELMKLDYAPPDITEMSEAFFNYIINGLPVCAVDKLQG